MTQNSLRYHELLETNRHNLATEDWSNRSLNETIRHNKATEYETNRSNLVNEQLKSEANQIASVNANAAMLNAYSNYNNSLTNARNADTTYLSYQETQRSNRVKEGEIQRHNLSDERIRAYLAAVAQQEADIAQYNAMTNRINAETNRSSYIANKAYNDKVVAETNRHNLASEFIQSLNNDRSFLVAKQNADAASRNASVNESKMNSEISKNQAQINLDQATSLLRYAQTLSEVFKSVESGSRTAQSWIKFAKPAR